MSFAAIIMVIFVICLAVLGHTVWHPEGIALFNVVVGFFTGGHVTG
jgi:hypothetical protein